MSTLNKIIVIGKIAKAPESRVTNDGTPFCKFVVNVERPYTSAAVAKNYDEFNVVTWRENSELIKDAQIDDHVLIEGSILTNTYDDAQGNRHWTTEIEGRQIKLLGQSTPNSQSFSGSNAVSNDQTSVSQDPSSMATNLEEKTEVDLKESDFDFSEPQNLEKEFTDNTSSEEIDETIPF